MEREEFLSSALSDQLNAGFVNLNWDQSMEQSSQFESALSSIVSSPSNPTPPADNVVIRELIGRLGSICNSGEMSPQSKNRYLGGGDNSTNTSCYSTPLNSPPKLRLSVPEHHHRVWGNPPVSGNPVPIPRTHLGGFATDPGFAERAAKFSCFGGGRSYGGLPRQFGMPEVGKLSSVSSSKSLKSGGGGGSQPDDGELGNAREESSVSDHVTIIDGGNARKRKAASRSKAKETPKVTVDESNGRKSRSFETKVEQNGGVESGVGDEGQGKESNSKPSEPPKQDYIHVRARRGQATDSHSLAERVRREKISERMKFLQDLVPGCNKVTGKAVMLDEIINYVQSLQRQVEFLSMKLATVNPRLDLENLIQKDMHGSSPYSVFPGDTSASTFPFVQQHTHPQSGVTNGLQSHCTINPLDITLRRPLNVQLPAVDGFGDATSLIGTLWEDDLQSVVQMGFGQNQEGLPFTGALPTGHMKVEL